VHLILYIVDVKQTLFYIKLTPNIISFTVAWGRPQNKLIPYITFVISAMLSNITTSIFKCNELLTTYKQKYNCAVVCGCML